MPFENLLEVTVIKNKLTAREREFCLSFMQSGDLSELRGRLLSAMSVIGYQRLAFGSAADAASLLFEENPSREALGKMDLFLVSEIRRPKDGAMEIKFFDRARALEKLASLSMERESSGSLYDAIGSVAERSEGDD